jgi:hypothetical protein
MDKYEDDQVLLFELYILKPELFYPDFVNRFFLNCIDYNFCTVNSSKKTSFVHTPGKSWIFYNKLCKYIGI